MSDTTTRALELLNLLQTHRHWLGPELAERLGVTERTVRRDVERLRTLGYRIESSSGATGGYRLEAGSALPPLLLNDEEAVAMAVGLRLAAAQRLLAGPDTTLTALAKLEQVLPGPLRRRVNALTSAMHPVATGQGAPVSPDVLGDLALACRDHERIRFDYTAADGADSRRFVEPHLLAPARRNWYLIAWDLDRGAWRTFRVDRIGTVDRTRTTFAPRPLSEDEADELILIATSMYRQRVEADVVMALALDDVVAHFGAWAEGASAEDEAHTRWPLGGADWRETLYGMLYVPEGVEFTTDLPEPHRAAMRESLVRVLRALDAAPPEPRADADGADPVLTVDG